MATTSINVQPIKGGSELHNTRTKDLDYVRPELTHLNESWSIDTVQNRLETIKENYQKTTGQTMQKKATPIREGVVVIEENTTMKDLQSFAQKAEERFGIKTIQIYTHKDEGHQGSQEWKPNLHAHIVFDWTQSNGKSCKLNRQDMAELQTILAECLGMDRGASSEKKHLTSLQYKNQEEMKSSIISTAQGLTPSNKTEVIEKLISIVGREIKPSQDLTIIHNLESHSFKAARRTLTISDDNAKMFLGEREFSAKSILSDFKRLSIDWRSIPTQEYENLLKGKKMNFNGYSISLCKGVLDFRFIITQEKLNVKSDELEK